MVEILPSQTLYITKVNDKIKRPEMSRSLYSLFSQFGVVLDIVIKRTSKMRGQAFVVFEDIPSAATAMRHLQGFPFYENCINISFSKTKSHAVMIRDGRFDPAPKPVEPTVDEESRKRPRQEVEEDEDSDDNPPAQKLKHDENPPHNILFLSNLSSESTVTLLTNLFQQYDGFVEVRLVPGKTDLAFVEYRNIQQATDAKDVLNGFKLTPTRQMIVDFAKQ